MSALIHPTAVISARARLGHGVCVGPYAVIEDDVEIGDGSVIGPHALIMRYTTLGPGCRVHAHAVLGDTPQDTSFKDCESRVRIGANCEIREGATVHRGTKPGSVTEVGDGCMLMANSHVAHNVRLGPGVILANGALLGGYAEVGARAFVSGNVLIHQFTRIGRLAMLSGASCLSQDVAPFCMTNGAMGNSLAGLNVVGMRRAGMTQAERIEVRRAFHILFRSDLNMTDALARLCAEFNAGPALEMAEFIRNSKRGVCRLAGRLGRGRAAEAEVDSNGKDASESG